MESVESMEAGKKILLLESVEAMEAMEGWKQVENGQNRIVDTVIIRCGRTFEQISIAILIGLRTENTR